MSRALPIFLWTTACLSGCSGSPIPFSPRSSNIDAASRYLDIVCPFNKAVVTAEAKYNNKKDLLQSGVLSLNEYAAFLDESLLSEAADSAQQAKAMTDPDFVWPESVGSLVKDLAAARLEVASASREFVRMGGYKAAIQQSSDLPDRPGQEAIETIQEKASAIRSVLRLPPRNEGCDNGKRALTVDQIKSLQQ